MSVDLATVKRVARLARIAVSDEDALAAFRRLSQLEGIIPALESSHAIAWLLGEGKVGDGDGNYDVLCLSGRGDKDLAEVLGMEDVE